MLARKVVTRSGRKIRGYFPSRKMGRMVAWESLLERDAILLMEFSRGILSFREQPERIIYHSGAESREYFPDFVVDFGHTIAHIEVKPTAQLRTPKVSQKLSHIFTHYDRQGRIFLILDETRIRQQPLLDNLCRLQSFNRPRQDIERLRSHYLCQCGQEGISLAEAIAHMGEPSILALLAYGVLDCDLEKPLCGHTLLALIKEGDHAPILL